MDMHGKRVRESLELDMMNKRSRHEGFGFGDMGVRGGSGGPIPPRDGHFGGFMGGGRVGGPFVGEPTGMSQHMRPPMPPGNMIGGMPMQGMPGPQHGMFMMGHPRGQQPFLGGPPGAPPGAGAPRPSMPPGMQQAGIPGMHGPMLQQPPGIQPQRQQQQQQQQQAQQLKASTARSAPGPAHKYEDIKAKRRESQAALLRRQVSNLELSPTLTRAPLYDQYQAMKQAAVAEGKAEGGLGRGSGDSSGFGVIPTVRRCYMLEAVNTAPEVLSMPNVPTSYNPKAALDASMQFYMKRMQTGQLIASKFGSVAVPAEFVSVVAAQEHIPT